MNNVTLAQYINYSECNYLGSVKVSAFFAHLALLYGVHWKHIRLGNLRANPRTQSLIPGISGRKLALTLIISNFASYLTLRAKFTMFTSASCEIRLRWGIRKSLKMFFNESVTSAQNTSSDITNEQSLNSGGAPLLHTPNSRVQDGSFLYNRLSDLIPLESEASASAACRPGISLTSLL